MAAITKKKTPAKRKTTRETKSAQQARKQMWAVVLFASGILLGALTLIEGESLWQWIHSFLFGLFSWSVYFLAPLMIYIAVIAAMDRPLSAIKAKLWQVMALIIMISGAIQIFAAALPDEGTLAANVVTLYLNGIELRGGGVMGALFSYPLLAVAGESGAKIIIILCIFVFIMLVTGSSLISLYQYLTRPVKGIEEAYVDAVESQRMRRAAKPPKAPKAPKAPRQKAAPSDPAPGAQSKFEIDIDISGDSDPADMSAGMARPETDAGLPAHPVISTVTVEPPPPPEEPAFPADRPVEYISPEEFAPTLRTPPAPESEPEPEAERAHPLDEEILRAEKEAEQEAEIEEIIGKFIGREQESHLPETELSPELEILPELDLLPPLEVVPAAETQPETAGPVESETLMELLPQVEVEILPEMGPGPREAEVLPQADAFSVPEILPERTPEPDPAPDPATVAVPSMELDSTPVRRPLVYRHPSMNLLARPKAASSEDISEELKNNAQTLVDTLKSFGVQTRITDICRGPAVTRYELQPSAGVKISKITGLADDIALNLASAGIRIEAPIPNKAAVGIEVPNKVVSVVSIREIIDSPDFGHAESSLSVALGKDIAGNIMLADLGKMPHVLIAGSTGSGKSVCINSIIVSLLYKSSPDEVKLLMVDPKVVELGIYNGIPHLLVPVVTDPKKAAGALNWAVTEMLNRYKAFADNAVRDLAGYNRLAEQSDELQPMPKIVIIIDELADLMMAAPGDVEDAICRLAQMARAAGMHLVIATQRPSVDVITGVIKANIPSRVAFAVSSQVDSRTILDMGGAEKLLGRGDMLFYPVGAAKPVRVQGCFVTDGEVEQVVEFVKQGDATVYDQAIVDDIERHVVADKGKGKDSGGGGFDEEDEMLPQAIECVVEMGQASTSALQRRLKLGYARAARIIDQLEQKGIVGPFEGSKPRQVLVSKERWMEMKLSGAEESLLGQSGESAGAPFDL